jgi:hypothetical protein
MAASETRFIVIRRTAPKPDGTKGDYELATPETFETRVGSDPLVERQVSETRGAPGGERRVLQPSVDEHGRHKID